MIPSKPWDNSSAIRLQIAAWCDLGGPTEPVIAPATGATNSEPDLLLDSTKKNNDTEPTVEHSAAEYLLCDKISILQPAQLMV